MCGQARENCSKQKEWWRKARRQEVTLGLAMGVGVERKVGSLVQVKWPQSHTERLAFLLRAGSDGRELGTERQSEPLLLIDAG